MYWESWSDFWQMGRHGFYVWTCVALVFLFVSLELIVLARSRRQAMKKLQLLNQQASVQVTDESARGVKS